MSQANNAAGAVLREAKTQWRKAAAALCGLPSRAERRGADAALAEQAGEYVRAYAAACGAQTLLAFAPLPDEPDVRPFLKEWRDEGRTLAFPVWEGGADMTLRRVDDPETDLRPGRAGILEPMPGCPMVAPEAVDIAIIPGRLFSEACERLGRGAGCYDKLLAGRRMYRVGVCYDYQVLPRVPSGGEDGAMDMVLTPSRVIVNPRSGR